MLSKKEQNKVNNRNRKHERKNRMRVGSRSVFEIERLQRERAKKKETADG